MSEPAKRNIVIIGGGIIGCTTAYYLTHHPSFSSSSTTVTVIEASTHGAAQGASGKAGGLVAKWAYPKELVDVSFDEKVKLAKRHGGKEKWGWRYVKCGSWEGRGEITRRVDQTNVGGAENNLKSLEKTAGLDGEKDRKAKGLPADLTWVREELTDAYSPMAKDGATAQVHPYLFTTSMLELARTKGAQFISGRACSVNQSNDTVTGVTYSVSGSKTQTTIPATQVILSAGAWSPNLLSALPLSATRAHSITIRPSGSTVISPYVLFTEITLPSKPHSVTVEIYARPDNEVYACGSGDDSALPPSVDDVVIDKGKCESIREYVGSISNELNEGSVEKRQACFLPVVTTGEGPIIGEARKVSRGLFVATGHTCWVGFALFSG
jgi:glycine/D-amino acid oxidase-like deaminating enzyme